MNKIYVIIELGYEYDDTYYSPPECGGGLPVKYYTDSKEAEKVCEEMNVEKRKNEDQHYYDCRIEDLVFYKVIEVPVG